jgi:rRNA maturation RNase YbeY
MHKGNISFNTENIKFSLTRRKFFKHWILETIKNEKQNCGEINFIFCDDEFLLNINKEYLNHSTLTDIITFDYSEKTDIISGDIFISIERITENAKKFKVLFETELSRVMIHGILHLIGYKDKSKSDKAQMTKKEDYYLTLQSESL